MTNDERKAAISDLTSSLLDVINSLLKVMLPDQQIAVVSRWDAKDQQIVELQKERNELQDKLNAAQAELTDVKDAHAELAETLISAQADNDSLETDNEQLRHVLNIERKKEDRAQEVADEYLEKIGKSSESHLVDKFIILGYYVERLQAELKALKAHKETDNDPV
jgi:septal ring factor EnvC (AmiA/AmiB activator)